MRLGMACATGDIITIQDADPELDPNECMGIIELIAADEWDVVYPRTRVKRICVIDRSETLHTLFRGRF